MSLYYVLEDDGKTPRLAVGVLEWAQFFEKKREDGELARRVALSFLPNGARVSTVFLGLDHNWNGGEPLLWETIIFGGARDGYLQRYSSYKDAADGHVAACLLAQKPEEET